MGGVRITAPLLVCWQRPWLMFLLLQLLIIGCYLPGLSGDFFIDDRGYTLNNPAITDTPIAQFWQLFTTMPEMEYLPIRDLSYLLDYQLFGDNPFGYKLHNFLLFLLLTLAVWLFSRRLLQLLIPLQPYLFQLALVLTALYMLHPSHVESVSWIAGRKDLLAALFCFLSLWLFAIALQHQQVGQAYWKPLLFSSLAFGCGLLSKSVVVPLGGFALFLAFWLNLQREGWYRGLAGALTISSPLLLLSMLGVVLHSWIGATVGIAHDWQQLNVQVQSEPFSLASYILLSLVKIASWPFALRLQYDVFPATGSEWWAWLQIGLIWLLLLWAVVRVIQRGSPCWLGLVMLLLFLSPYLQWVPFDTWSLASERFLVIGVFGLMLSLLLLLLRLPSRLYYGVLAIIVVAFSLQSMWRVEQWGGDGQSLIVSGWQREPDYFASAALRIRNVDMVNGDWQQAMTVAQGIRHPSFRNAMLALIGFQYHLSRPQQSSEQLNLAWQQLMQLHQAIEQSKGELRSIAHYNFYRDITGLAVDAYLQMLPYSPESIELHYRLAQMHLNHNADYSREDAEKHLQRALQLARQKGVDGTPILQLLETL